MKSDNVYETLYLKIGDDKFTLTGFPPGDSAREAWLRVCDLRESQIRRGMMKLGWAPVDKHRPFRYLWDCFVLWLRENK